MHGSASVQTNYVQLDSEDAEDWLKPVYECLHEELVKRQVFHVDDTKLQVLHEPEKSAHTGTAICGCTGRAAIQAGILYL